MVKTDLIVPSGIRFIGDWGDFDFNKFPQKCIIDKVLPGCGFTEYCIRSHCNVILCSPRKMLLQNKAAQHPGEVYLVKNELEQDTNVDQDITGKKKALKQVIVDKTDDPSKNNRTLVKSRIKTELGDYLKMNLGKAKILVTYDSFRIVKEILEEYNLFQGFYVIVDEFQTVMQDSRFKSSTELNFLWHLQQSHSAIFVSATPMLDEYLEELDEFKDLPFFKLDWKTEDPGRIAKPNLNVQLMDSIIGASKKVLDKFKQGNYESVVVNRGGTLTTIEAKELVFYVNSVDKIISIIKNNELPDSLVNILCSNTPENQTRIWRSLGKKNGYNIGEVPLPGELRKPITICTRTVYLGADFYSDCAKSFIFSDSNLDCLSVDISLDLPQILGRQRLLENPWKNEATFFYKTTADYRGKSKEDFDKRILEKTRETENLLIAWNDASSGEIKESLSKKYLAGINSDHYKSDYVAVNKIELVNESGAKSFMLMPVKNNLVLVSEKRAFDIQQRDYSDRFSVFTSIENQISGAIESSEKLREFFAIYEKYTKVSDKLKYLCEYQDKDLIDLVLRQLSDSDKVKEMYTVIGPERCKADGYNITDLNKSLGVVSFSPEILCKAIYFQFHEGDRYSLKDIKSLLTQIYSTISFKKTPKASDLESFFEIKIVNMKVEGKRVKGYELIKKLK